MWYVFVNSGRVPKLRGALLPIEASHLQDRREDKEVERLTVERDGVGAQRRHQENELHLQHGNHQQRHRGYPIRSQRSQVF